VAAFAFGVSACTVQASSETSPVIAADEPPSAAATPRVQLTLGSASECTPVPAATNDAAPRGWFDMDFTGQDWANGSRYLHSAVWDGREMIVFGGAVGSTPLVASYDPSNDRWSHVADPPIAPRVRHVGVWTGHAMLVFGGETPDVLTGDETTATPFSDGALYDPCRDAWTSIAQAPFAWQRGSSAVFSPRTRELIVFGGSDDTSAHAPTNQGFAYSVETDTWRAIAPSPLAPRVRQSAVWSGDAMIVFGGFLQDGSDPHDAASYDPKSDRWTMLTAPPSDAPRGEDGVMNESPASATFWGGRTSKTAVDGSGTGYFATNGVTFDVATSDWRSIPAPSTTTLSERTNAMVWMANEKLFVFGGHVDHDVYDPVSHTAQDGAFFDLSTRAWTRIDRPLAYVMREGASVVWTGREALIVGGAASCTMCNPLPRGGVVFRP
jgi:N-acetylneuraminic acid mutarotase